MSYQIPKRFFLFIFALLFLPTGSYAQNSIEWRVENPFRLFLNPDHTNAHIELYQSLTEEEKKNPVLSMERRLALQNERGWAEEIFRETCWDETRNRYRFCRGKGVHYISPKKHRVFMRLTGEIVSTDRCEWRLFKKGKRARKKPLLRQMALCSDEVPFEIPYPAGGIIEVTKAGETPLWKVIKVEDLLIVGLGDSFASGEGNPDDPVQFSDDRAADYGKNPAKMTMAGYPTRQGSWNKIGDGPFLREAARWQSRACHRSLYSYQLRTALQLAIEDPHRAVTFVGFACSGSEITIGMFLNYKGNEWTKFPPQLPQLSYVSEELCGRGKSTPKDYTSGYTQLGKLTELQNMILNKCYKPKRKIDLLLVSIGGNDVGFSSLVGNAIMQDKSLLKKVGGWIGSVSNISEAREKLNILKTRYTALNKAFHYMLKIPWPEADRILLTAYPRMERTEDGRSMCSSGNKGMDLYPDFSVVKDKLKDGAVFADELYQLMQQSSKRFGWTFVDEHRDLFAAHGFCAVNGSGDTDYNENLSLPRSIDNRWLPYSPSQFKPYASRQRWFRTPNDAYMTAHFHSNALLSRRLMRSKSAKWFQIVLAGIYSGSFHPTAEGHAAIADSVVRKARKVLNKYKTQ